MSKKYENILTFIVGAMGAVFLVMMAAQAVHPAIIGDEEAIFSHLTDQNRIYYFDTLQIGEFHLQEDCTEENIIFTDIGTCLIEDIPVRIYRVERGE